MRLQFSAHCYCRRTICMHSRRRSQKLTWRSTRVANIEIALFAKYCFTGVRRQICCLFSCYMFSILLFIYMETYRVTLTSLLSTIYVQCCRRHVVDTCINCGCKRDKITRVLLCLLGLAFKIKLQK